MLYFSEETTHLEKLRGSGDLPFCGRTLWKRGSHHDSQDVNRRMMEGIKGELECESR